MSPVVIRRKRLDYFLTGAPGRDQIGSGGDCIVGNDMPHIPRLVIKHINHLILRWPIVFDATSRTAAGAK